MHLHIPTFFVSLLGQWEHAVAPPPPPLPNPPTRSAKTGTPKTECMAIELSTFRIGLAVVVAPLAWPWDDWPRTSGEGRSDGNRIWRQTFHLCLVGTTHTPTGVWEFHWWGPAPVRLFSRCCTVYDHEAPTVAFVAWSGLFPNTWTESQQIGERELNLAFTLYTLLYHRQNTWRGLCFGLVCDWMRMYLFALRG